MNNFSYVRLTKRFINVDILNVDMDNINKKKVSTSISLDYESYEHIKNKKINLSDWVNGKIQKEFRNKKEMIKTLKLEIEEREKYIKRLQEDIKEETEEQEKEMEKLTNEQLKEIKESIKILEERGNSFFEGRYNKYKNLFDNNITKEGFTELLKICNI